VPLDPGIAEVFTLQKRYIHDLYGFKSLFSEKNMPQFRSYCVIMHSLLIFTSRSESMAQTATVLQIGKT
jgi:hypothetical protein